MEISTSFLSSNYDLDTTLKKIDETSSDYVHVDIMDGILVQNKTMNIEKYIRKLNEIKMKKDVHLMCMSPKEYIDKFKNVDPEYITFHIESDCDIIGTIEYIKSLDIKPGLAISPKTDIIEILPYLELIDMVIVMTVEPGAGGQRIMFDMLEKVEFLSKLNTTDKYNFKISVDGGINEYTAIKAKKSGVNVLVSGSYICKSENYEERIKKLKR